MEKYQFKTNIKCSGCIAQVTPHLNAVKGIEKWEVDLENPDRTLTVIVDGSKPGEIEEAISKAGYSAQKLRG
jgi:copper chaperone